MRSLNEWLHLCKRHSNDYGDSGLRWQPESGLAKRPPPRRPNAQISPSSLAEVPARLAVAAPVLRKYPRSDIAVKRGMRPVSHACDKSMPDRVDVAILDMARVVRQDYGDSALN